VLDLPSAERDKPGETTAEFNERIEFRGVSFRVRGVGGGAARRGSRGRARPGRRDRRPSGAGKTTLVDLLPRFYEPTRGEILLDGVPLTNYTRTSLRRLMGIVSQETVLLNDTVLANIAYGLKDVRSIRCVPRPRAANAENSSCGCPRTYNTVLGERGTRLSGGQRQRIAIARALAPRSPSSF